MNTHYTDTPNPMNFAPFPGEGIYRNCGGGGRNSTNTNCIKRMVSVECPRCDEGFYLGRNVPARYPFRSSLYGECANTSLPSWTGLNAECGGGGACGGGAIQRTQSVNEALTHPYVLIMWCPRRLEQYFQTVEEALVHTKANSRWQIRNLFTNSVLYESG